MWLIMSVTVSTKFEPVKALYGAPQVFEDICLLYPITMGQIAQIGVDEFYRLLNHITVHPPTLNKKLKDVDGYTFLLENGQNVEYAKTTRQAVSLFLHEECLIMPEAGVFALGGSTGDSKFQIVTKEKFALIQDIIRQQHWLEPVLARAEQSTSKRTQEILDRLARGRQTVAQLKQNQGEGGPSFVDLISSMSLAIPGLSILNIWDLTYYAFYDQFQRYQQKEAYEHNLKAAFAGAKIPKDKLKGWIRPIEK